MSKKRLLTGIQPSGSLHIGNYFGAIKPFLDIYKDYDSFLMIANYHALTSVRNPETLRKNTYNAARDFLAIGLETEKCVLFRQSDNPDHTELAWVLNCMVSVPFLMQAHSYKDKVARGLDASAGLFVYPMLMAADIVLYDIDVVPVGEDQRQHLEYTREAVNKFNLAFGETLKAPKELILDSVGVVKGTDGQKMSKSYGNTIPLFGTREEIQIAVMSIVTDEGGILPATLHDIHELVRGHITNDFIKPDSAKEFYDLYTQNKSNYKYLKETLIEDLDTWIAPMREKRDSINDRDIETVLKQGAEKARAKSADKMREVRDRIGINL